MPQTDFPFGSETIEQLAYIIDRARSNNGVSTNASRTQLSSELTDLFQDIFAVDEPPRRLNPTPWDMITEETPTPTRRYKIFAQALAADDPLAILKRNRSNPR